MPAPQEVRSQSEFKPELISAVFLLQISEYLKDCRSGIIKDEDGPKFLREMVNGVQQAIAAVEACHSGNKQLFQTIAHKESLGVFDFDNPGAGNRHFLFITYFIELSSLPTDQFTQCKTVLLEAIKKFLPEEERTH